MVVKEPDENYQKKKGEGQEKKVGVLFDGRKDQPQRLSPVGLRRDRKRTNNTRGGRCGYTGSDTATEHVRGSQIRSLKDCVRRRVLHTQGPNPNPPDGPLVGRVQDPRKS